MWQNPLYPLFNFNESKQGGVFPVLSRLITSIRWWVIGFFAVHQQVAILPLTGAPPCMNLPFTDFLMRSCSIYHGFCVAMFVCGWWLTCPSEKNQAVGMITVFPIYGKIKNVPKHQPGLWIVLTTWIPQESPIQNPYGIQLPPSRSLAMPVAWTWTSKMGKRFLWVIPHTGNHEAKVVSSLKIG